MTLATGLPVSVDALFPVGELAGVEPLSPLSGSTTAAVEFAWVAEFELVPPEPHAQSATKITVMITAAVNVAAVFW